MSGVRSTELPEVPAVDSLIGNSADGTVTINIARLAALLNNYVGPAYKTRALLYADLNWSAKSLAQVYGDSTSAYNGTYQKAGNSGSGSWTRIGDLPPSAVGASLVAAEGDARALADTGLRNAVRDGAILALINVAGSGNAITADLSASATSAGITDLGTNTALDLRPTATNTAANPTLTIAGTSYGIRDADGGAWPANAFVPGRSYLLRRRGAILRVISGDMTGAELAALRDALVVADMRRPLWPHIRPGDAPGLFTTDPNAAPAAAPFVTDTVSTASGRVARISGAGVVATRDMQAVEPGRTYKARYVAQRNVNPTDPAGDAVTFGAVWYNRFGARISATVVNTLILNVGDGRQEFVATFGVADDHFNWPAGAAYARPFVQAFGSDGVTYVEIIDWLDVTDATLWSPDVSEFASRIGAVESWSAGDRLDILEAEVGTPSTMRFLTEAAAAAASIPAGVEVLDIIGTGLLRRDPSGLSLTTADGARWKWIADTVAFTSFAEIMSSPAAGYAAGTVLFALAENVSYEVLSIGAPGVHYITSGGVRLRALGGIVLLAAGQSNIESTSVHAAGGDLTPDPRIRVWSAGAGVFVTWDPAAGVPVGMASAGRNFVLFQAAKAALRNGVPAVYCINDGHAGDAIAQWVGAGTSSPNFQSLQTAINNAFASPELTSQGIKIVSGMIWGQGESDGSATFSLPYYRSAFETLKGQLRALSRFPPSTPITVLEMPPQPSAVVTNAYIMNALPYDDDPWTSVTRTKGLPIGEDNLHWTGAAMNGIGMRAWTRLAEKSGDSLHPPYRLTTPFFKVRFDPVFGKGLGITYSATDDRMDVGSSSDAAGDTLQQRFFGLRIAGNEMEVYQNVRLFHGLGLMTHGNPDFLNAAHAVNTSPNKRAGVVRWNAANNSLMVATGSGATAPWAQIPSASLVTPT